jgi:hypothetical protein
MPKGRIVGKGAGAVSRGLKKAGAGAKAVAAAEAVDAVTDNPYVQAGIGAVEGAALGGAVGGPIGAVTGGAVGGLIGFVLADGERIVPVDMIAIPAYQYSMVLQGKEPTFQIYIKEGELIAPVLPTDMMQSQMVVDAVKEKPTRSKNKKLNSWQKYIKQNKNKIYYKSGKNKGKLNLKAMAKAGGFGKGRKK